MILSRYSTFCTKYLFCTGYDAKSWRILSFLPPSGRCPSSPCTHSFGLPYMTLLEDQRAKKGSVSAPQGGLAPGGSFTHGGGSEQIIREKRGSLKLGVNA